MAAIVRSFINGIIDTAILEVTNLQVSQVEEDGFSVVASGSLRRTGPLPAIVTFPERSGDKPALRLLWKTNLIAQAKVVPGKIKIRKKLGRSQFELGPVKLALVQDNKAVDAFTRAVIDAKDDIRVDLEGRLRVKSLGLSFAKIKLRKPVVFAGLDRLSAQLCRARDLERWSTQDRKRRAISAGRLDILHGRQDCLVCTASIDLAVPKTVLDLDLGNVKLTVAIARPSEGLVDIGSLTFGSSFHLTAGSNTFKARLELELGKAGQAGSDFVSSFLSGQEPLLYIRFGGDLHPAWLRRALGEFVVLAAAPQLSEPIVAKGDVIPGKSEMQAHSASDASIELVLANPFSTPITVRSLKGSALAYGIELGKLDLHLTEADAIRLSANATTVTAPQSIALLSNPADLVDLLTAAAAAQSVSLARFERLLMLVDPSRASPGASDHAESARDEDDLAAVASHVLANLQASFKADVDLAIGDYTLATQLAQDQLPVKVSESLISQLLAQVAEKAVQPVIRDMALEVTHLSLREESGSLHAELDLKISGLPDLSPSITRITFPNGIDICSQDFPAAKFEPMEGITLTDISSDSYTLKGKLDISDVGRMAAVVESIGKDKEVSLGLHFDVLRVDVAGITAIAQKVVKPVSIRGLDGFSGLELKAFDLPQAGTRTSGLTLKADAELSNPSALSMNLVDIDASLCAEGVTVGTIKIPSLSLAARQTTSMAIHGSLSTGHTNESRRAFENLSSQVVSGQTIICHAYMQSARLENGMTLGWLVEGLKTVPIPVPVTLPSTAAVELIGSVTLSTVSFRFETQERMMTPVVSCPNVVCAIKSPVGFDFKVKQLTGDIGVTFGGKRLGQLHLQCAVEQASSSITFDIKSAHLSDSNHEGLQSVAGALARESSVTLQLDMSNLFATVDTTAGSFDLRCPSVPVDTSIAALQKLSHMTMQLTEVHIIDGQRSGLVLSIQCYLNNPSDLDIYVASHAEAMERAKHSQDTPDDGVSLSVAYGDQKTFIGRAYVLGAMEIKPGATRLSIEFRYSPSREDQQHAGLLLSGYLSGVESNVLITGDERSSTNEILRAALTELDMRARLKPIAHKTLITSIEIRLGVQAAMSKVRARFQLENPFDLAIKIDHIRCQATYKGKAFGVFSQDFEDFEVPPVSYSNHKYPNKTAGHQNSPLVTVKLEMPLDDVVKAYLASRGTLRVDVAIKARIRLGDYEIEDFAYDQPRLAVSIVGLEAVSSVLSWIP
ncbi:uncharacterized protein L969DRAFT_16929 [Mixia osmundae IAM 14324]|uniref:uncharacterized protein n=1 Tax=Mixia osmundae (strain CBS 9802 / IAM 14324 / JCM 22182 / KY 12970) TaxID=764103 RepID=UPI0004A546B9|nr:uncharacterized protein L969DRAFT_16929 [Mixia osmundae IAM 14324]KEI40264.1 hypothetical protein L969DRAFT_16929 [Mixia osmundae IAM 14324]